MMIWRGVLHLFLILICEAKKPDEHGAVCDYPMAGAICFGDIFPVYIYNPNTRRCFASYDCSYFGNKFPTLGECRGTCMISAGNQEVRSTTRSSTNVSSTVANFDQSRDVRHGSSLQSKSSLVAGYGVRHTGGQGSANAATGSTRGSVQANELKASITPSTLLKKATEQQEITHSFGSSQGASREHGNFSTSVGQQLPQQPNLTAVRAHLRPKAPMADKRCHVKSEISTHKCRQRWYLDTESGKCLPSCSREAPFLSKVACDEVCRSGKTRGQGSSNGRATSSQSTGTPTSSTTSSVHDGGTSWGNRVPATQHKRKNTFISDYRCTIHPRNSSLKCQPRGWYFHQHTRLCVPSCGIGAFTTQFECMGACRSVEACGFPVESSLCLLKVFAVYAYDPIAKGCFMAYDCSLFGNKFPTARECQRTCEGGRFEALTQKIDYDSLLAAGQQRMVGPPGSFQSQTQIGGSGGVGLSQFPTGPGQLPGSTQVSGSNDSWNTSLQHQTSSSQQSSATSLTGTTISSTENGQQQGGHTSTGSQTLSTTAGGTTHVTGSQSSTGGGAVVIQTINGHGQVTGTTQLLGPQGTMSTSTEQQTGSSQLTQGSGTATTHGSIQGGLQQQGGQTATGTNVSSANGIISTTEVSTSQSSAGGIIVTQVTKGQEESQKQTGIIKEGSSQTGNQGPSGGQQKPRPELKLPTIYVSKLRPPPIDKDCKVTLSYVPARRCRRPRWYYDSEKKACRPSCTKEAPFYNKIACDGVCRTLEACDFPMASIPCFFRKVHVVYIYNQWKKKCMKGYDCSYFGNKFPTLRECQQTCKLYEALRHVKNTTQSSSQVSTKREKIISTMSQQQKVSQSAISSVQGSLSSQTSHGHESTSTISSSAQLSQSAGQSATQQNSETGSGVQINGGSQHQTITGAGVGSHHSTEGETTISSGGAHHNMESSTTSSFQQSSQISHSLSSSSHQISQSHTGSSAHLQIETNGIGTGAGQQNTIHGTTGSSENSIHTNHNDLTGSGQHGSSVSGSPSDSGLVGHQVVSGGQHQSTTSGAGSWHTSSHISGSDTSVSHQTGSSSSGVSASSSTHGQLQETVETCGAPLKTALCMFDVYAMYAYDAYSGTCFMLYDCSLHGNKFPTIQTCRHACVRGAPALPGGAQVSVSQGKWNASTQQRGQQSFTGPTEAGKQVSSQGQISAGQMITRQSTVGGGVSETEMTAQEKREMDKAAAIDEEWFNQQGKLSTLEEQQQFLQKMKLPSVKVSKPKPLPIDPECLITAPPAGKRRCRRRWYYNKNTKTCLPSCSKNAPFSNNIACDGVCRTLEACDFPKASLFCFFRKAYPVYIYDRNSKHCYQGYDCSNFGNKFPTLKECENTCRLYEEKQLKMAARNTTEISIKQQKMMDAMNHQQSVLQSSTSSAHGSLSLQAGTGIPTPVQAGAIGGSELPAHVPAIQAENNNLPISGNSASQGQATGAVNAVKE